MKSETEPVELISYQGTYEDDARLLEWYQTLLGSGDIGRLLWPQCQPLGAFFWMWRDGKRILYYALDEHGKVWLASWFEPVLSRMSFMSLWIRKDCRYSRMARQYVEFIYREAFKYCTVLLGTTKQEKLLEAHRRSGYEVMGKLPLGWGGVEDCWLLSLTEERFTMRRPPRGSKE